MGTPTWPLTWYRAGQTGASDDLLSSGRPYHERPHAESFHCQWRPLANGAACIIEATLKADDSESYAYGCPDGVRQLYLCADLLQPQILTQCCEQHDVQREGAL